MKRYFLFIIMFVFVSISQAQNFKKRFDAKISIGTVYDDNILKYSDKYIESFLNREEPERFSIDTYDDVFVKTKLQASYFIYLFKNKKTKFNASYQRYNYIKNSIKTWGSFSLGLQQFLTKKMSFKISYNYIPNFYVRNFRDEDWVNIYGYEPESFQTFSFSKDNYGFWIQQKFNKTKIRLTTNRMIYYYNSNYTEYDATNQAFGIRVNQRINKKVAIELGYQYTESKAKGFDEANETIATSDDVDASFNEDKYNLKLSLKLPKIRKKKHSISIKGIYVNRYFLTDRLITFDPLHVGRIDNNLTIQTIYSIRIRKNLNVNLFYNRYQRISTNKGLERDQTILSNEKDYKQNQFGCVFNYSIF